MYKGVAERWVDLRGTLFKSNDQITQVRMLTWVTKKGKNPRLKLMDFYQVTASKFTNLKD